jgi:hypothetical protein
LFYEFADRDCGKQRAGRNTTKRGLIMRGSSASASVESENRLHEASLVAQNATRFLCVIKGLLALGIAGYLVSVNLVFGQTGKTEKRQRDIVGAFVWKKVPVVLSSESVYDRNPHPGVGFEFLFFEGVYHVTQITCYHPVSSAIFLFVLKIVRHRFTAFHVFSYENTRIVFKMQLP